MAVTSRVEPRSTRGKIVQFGRGMIEAVSKQLFKEFVTACCDARHQANRIDAANVEPQRHAN